ncbi:MAG: long-chain fatty acid--CoA ligase [bacterium]
MPALKKYKTIPEIFSYLTEVYGKGNEKPVFLHKIEGVYKPISYNEFKLETEQFANGLASLGIKRGHKVAIIAENRPEWVYSDFAILGLGGIDIPLYPILTADTIQFIINDCESIAIIVSNKFQLNKVLKIRDKCKSLKYIIVMNEKDSIPEQGVYSFTEVKRKGKEFATENKNHFTECIKLCNENDLCTIIYTSGTTGEPKGVMLTHKNIISNMNSAHQVFNLSPADTFLSFLPLCHIFERLAGYYTAMAGGSTIAYAESIEKIAINMEEIKPTVMTAVPRLFERMYSKIKRNVESQSVSKQKIFTWAVETGKEYAIAKKSPAGVSLTLSVKHALAQKLVFHKLQQKMGGKLRFFISGGAPLSRDLGLFFEAVGLLVLEGYGLTESSPVLAVNKEGNYKFGTVGKIFPGVEIKIAQDGEILAYGPNIMKGYYNNKKETDAVLKDGWLYTGDIGVFDAEGFLIITDRKKHLFKTSQGKYIAPSPIENMFLASKYIDQFILIGDRRMFLSALIVPDFEAIKEYADANRIQYTSVDDLLNMKQIYDIIDKDLTQFQKKLANYERVRKFTLLDKPFTIEEGTLTPSLKIKRKEIESRYKNLIEDMYSAFED